MPPYGNPGSAPVHGCNSRTSMKMSTPPPPTHTHSLSVLVNFECFVSVVDLGGREGRAPPPPPWAPKFFRFHAVFGQIWQNRMLAPPPPRGNPGSSAVCVMLFMRASIVCYRIINRIPCPFARIRIFNE